MVPLKQTPYWNLLAEAAAFLSRSLPAQNSQTYLEAICADANEVAKRWEGKEGMWLMYGMLHEILDELCRAGGLTNEPVPERGTCASPVPQSPPQPARSAPTLPGPLA